MLCLKGRVVNFFLAGPERASAPGKRMEFRNQDKSLRRQMVIDAAVKVFHQKGYRAATLDDVASELGLTKPALYHYVSSKEDLLSQIYLRALESFFQTIYEIREMDLSPLDKLRCFVRRHLEQIVVKNLAMFSVFFSEENELPRKDFLKIRTEKRKFSRVVEDIIQEGIDLGIFRAVDPRLQANAIIGMCNWLYRWYRPGRSPYSPAQIAEQFLVLVENGLTRPPGDRKERGLRSRRGLAAELRALSREMDRLADAVERS